ncbi:MAG: ABC transporter ATP-binding protein [Intrasporangium sp.]|uniref:ABC transporter ATP-binding protein n=1 Tax=Intrasporangium sp. TaxID=1925024 RepID=UPI003F7EB0FC
MSTPTDVLVKGTGLVKHYPAREPGIRGRRLAIKAVDGVDIELRTGECLALVGESGCGKSTLASLLTNLEPLTSGIISVGHAQWGTGSKADRRLRRRIQIVLQDPYSALNPRMTVDAILREPLQIHSDLVPTSHRTERVVELLEMVGLNASHRHRYPHEFSGGQRQRICIARALAVEPEVLVCDEPLSALDVSVQGQILELFRDLRERLGLSYVFISHDLAVVRSIADRVAVMYLGRVVEQGPTEAVYENPKHPYTQALLSSAPVADPSRRDESRRIVLAGEVPSPANPPTGCTFRTRCWRAVEACASSRPPLEPVGPSHRAACIRVHLAGSEE